MLQLNPWKALKVWPYGRRKRRYLKARQELLASYGDVSRLTADEVAEFEAKKIALRDKYMGDGNGNRKL